MFFHPSGLDSDMEKQGTLLYIIKYKDSLVWMDPAHLKFGVKGPERSRGADLCNGWVWIMSPVS